MLKVLRLLRFVTRSGPLTPGTIAPNRLNPRSKMTTQAPNLLERLPALPIRVQREDRTTYMEDNLEEVLRMVKAGVVEGVGPRSGRIDILRITVTHEIAVERMKAVAMDKLPAESPGSITSMASREVYRETLGDGISWTWNFKQNRTLFA
jgi:hypothetical protein